MDGQWFESLRPLCEETCRQAAVPSVDVVLFYAARWCQKWTGDPAPRVARIDGDALAATAGRIVRNLAQDGARVDRLVAGDGEEWTGLRRLLLASAASRAPQTAGDHADEALQKIAVVLLTGTPPSRAVERLGEGPEGPRNEYIFASPFANWARTVVINQVIDQLRRARRERRLQDRRLRDEGRPQASGGVDVETLASTGDSLTSLVRAIEALPPVQRSVMLASLCRRDLDEELHQRLHEIASDLSVHGDELPASDEEIAESLGTTAHRLAASRSVARRKLASLDPMWALLLDGLLPHRSTRPLRAPARARERSAARGEGQ